MVVHAHSVAQVPPLITDWEAFSRPSGFLRWMIALIQAFHPAESNAPTHPGAPQRPFCWWVPKKESQRVANNSRTVDFEDNFSKAFWRVMGFSFMPWSESTGRGITTEGGPKNWKNQQEILNLTLFRSVFRQTNTSRTLLGPKNVDPESYTQIGGKKFRTRFCGHLFSRQLQNGAYFLFGKGFPTTWGRLERLKSQVELVLIQCCFVLAPDS